MPFPATLSALEAAGYTYSNQAQCRACLRLIEFWVTPLGRRIPIDAMSMGADAPVVSHFATCPAAGDFRRRTTPPKGKKAI